MAQIKEKLKRVIFSYNNKKQICFICQVAPENIGKNYLSCFSEEGDDSTCGSITRKHIFSLSVTILIRIFKMSFTISSHETLNDT